MIQNYQGDGAVDAVRADASIPQQPGRCGCGDGPQWGGAVGCGTVRRVSYILDEEPIGARLRVALLRTHIGNALSAICSFSCGTARNTAVAPVPVVRPPDMRISIFFFPHEIRPLTTPKRQKPVR